jgi:hypothetical protein
MGLIKSTGPSARDSGGSGGSGGGRSGGSIGDGFKPTGPSAHGGVGIGCRVGGGGRVSSGVGWKQDTKDSASAMGKQLEALNRRTGGLGRDKDKGGSGKQPVKSVDVKWLRKYVTFVVCEDGWVCFKALWLLCGLWNVAFDSLTDSHHLRYA